MDEVKEWEVEKILNKRKIRGVVKYLLYWKKFTAESNAWEREENLENIRKVAVELEERLSAEVRRQDKLVLVEE